MKHQTRSARSAVIRLAFARGISITGGAAAYTALMFSVYERTGKSAVWLSATLLVTFGVNGLLGWFAGMLGDRFDRRRVMIVSDLAGAVVFFAMSVVHDPGLLLVFAFLTALAEAPFFSASGAAIPNLVDSEEEIAWANSLIAIGRNAGIFLGPAIGGFLVDAVGAGWVFTGNAVTFLVSAVLVWSVRRRFNEDREGHEEHAGVTAGLRFIARDRVLRGITLAWSFMVVFLGLTMVSDLPLVEHFFRGGDVGKPYGILIACWGFGSILGSMFGRRLTARTEPRWVLLGTVWIGVTLMGMGLAPVFVPVLGFVLANGIGDAVALVAEQGIQQRRTPDAVRSRVVAATEASLNIAVAVGYLIAAPLLSLLGPRVTYVVAGAGSLVAALMLVPVYRTARRAVGEPALDVEPRELEPAN